MLFSVLLLLPSITGFADHIQVKAPLAYSNPKVVRVVERSELVAQSVSKDIHKRCLAARDYTGCIQSNSGQLSGVIGPTKDSESILDREQCFDAGVCKAQSGQDQLGLPKLVGWIYSYDPASNTVECWKPEAKRVPHKEQPSRYIAVNYVQYYYQ